MIRSLYPNIDAERVRLGLSVEELAAKLSITRKTYYNWVKRGDIPYKRVCELADFFNVSADYLLQGGYNEQSKETKQEKLQRMIESLRQQNS